MAMPDQIETTRLLLRPYRWQDIDDVVAYATDETWAKYLPVPTPYTLADGQRFLASQVLLDRETQPCWAIESAGRIVGGINLRFTFEHRLGELGYAVARDVWGSGIATESAAAVVDAAFSTYPDLNRIRAIGDARNEASLRVMARLGMVREGVLRQNRVFRGDLVDEVWCGVLRSEWASRTRG